MRSSVFKGRCYKSKIKKPGDQRSIINQCGVDEERNLRPWKCFEPAAWMENLLDFGSCCIRKWIRSTLSSKIIGPQTWGCGRALHIHPDQQFPDFAWHHDPHGLAKTQSTGSSPKRFIFSRSSISTSFQATWQSEDRTLRTRLRECKQ